MFSRTNYSKSISNYRPEEGDRLKDHIGMDDTRPCLAPGFVAPSRPGCHRTKHVPTARLYTWRSELPPVAVAAASTTPDGRPLQLKSASYYIPLQPGPAI
ncbi:hypothetical protein GUJ93_ZPchr0002g24062 [Zizania palustris]|uniref:Uncharacterized protein n=1 Tax=Zizania palustris TaxID=103762 RepID=A0A8J5VV74_ZIZPA|nr:hypothetical protein GUJ93_ZPchr0002g24062 [Zizania palustris]